MTEQLSQFINTILQHHKVPKEWKTSIIIVIFKKGDIKEPENYRAIILLNTILKMTTKIFTELINQRISLEDEQQGFRCGRSCTDDVFVIKPWKKQ